MNASHQEKLREENNDLHRGKEGGTESRVKGKRDSGIRGKSGECFYFSWVLKRNERNKLTERCGLGANVDGGKKNVKKMKGGERYAHNGLLCKEFSWTGEVDLGKYYLGRSEQK